MLENFALAKFELTLTPKELLLLPVYKGSTASPSSTDFPAFLFPLRQKLEAGFL